LSGTHTHSSKYNAARSARAWKAALKGIQILLELERKTTIERSWHEINAIGPQPIALPIETEWTVSRLRETLGHAITWGENGDVPDFSPPPGPDPLAFLDDTVTLAPGIVTASADALRWMLANSIISGILETNDGNAQIEATFWSSSDADEWFDELNSDGEFDCNGLSFRVVSVHEDLQPLFQQIYEHAEPSRMRTITVRYEGGLLTELTTNRGRPAKHQELDLAQKIYQEIRRERPEQVKNQTKLIEEIQRRLGECEVDGYPATLSQTKLRQGILDSEDLSWLQFEG